ncbi:MAG: KamA family radical SAM protein, partial [Chlorobiales bacterium]|nr:KamA family radical SAM protein [Chlorobiales bacterium]
MSLSITQEQIFNSIDSTANHSYWKDWKWQMRHSIRDIETFETLLDIQLTAEQRKAFKETVDKFPMSITPYYLSLINTKDMQNDPIFLQSVPLPQELHIYKGDMSDPLHEDADSPAPCITHRYPDRVLLLVSNTCPMYCRHCTRKRKVGDQDTIPTKTVISKGIDYIRQTPEIRDVLLSGGDPFLLSDEYLDWILTELRSIEHVEIIRIGTRTPVVL